MSKILTDEKALELAENLLENDKLVKKTLEEKIPNIEGLASETYVDDAIKNAQLNNENTNLTGYATEVYVDEKISEIDIPNLTGYATETYVDNKIATISNISAENIYYISSDGSDDNDGHSELFPKKTWNDLLINGNVLMFKGGDEFVLDNPICPPSNCTITSYGEGKAKFTGFHTSTETFVATSVENLYSITFSKDIDPGYIILEGETSKNWKRLTTEPTSYREGEWYFDRTNKILHYYSSTSVEGKTISYSIGKKGMIISNVSNVIVSNIELCDFAYHGVSMEANASNIYISNNYIHDIGGGIDTQKCRYGNAVQMWLTNEHDIYVEDNIISDVFDTGITPQGTSSNDDCYNLYIRRNNVRRCAFMLEFFNSSSNIAVTAHFEDNFCYQVKDITDGYRTPGDYAYTHLSFILVWNSASDNDRVYFKNNICVESEYCALAFSQNTVRNKLIFEDNLFICNAKEDIHNSYVLDELPKIITLTSSIKPVENLERIYFKVNGGYYWNTSGEFSECENAVSATTIDNLIPVTVGEKYRVSLAGIWVGTNPTPIAFFDSDKNYVGAPYKNTNVANKEFEIPENVAYMGITVWSGVEPVIYRLSTLDSYSRDKIIDEHLTRMRHEQNIQHSVKIPYYKTPTKPYLTFVHDDCRTCFDVLAQHFIDRDIPLCVAVPPPALVMKTSGTLCMREVIDNVVGNGGEVLAHHAQQMTQEMLEDYDTCFEHFVTSKRMLEDCGYDVNGIILAGGVGQVLGSPISDMWVRSYYLYSDLYGESEYAEPYNHGRQSLVNLKTFEKAKARIETAIENNEWLVMYMHDWNDFPEEELIKLLDWVNEQGIEVNTYKQVYDELIAYKDLSSTDSISQAVNNYMEENPVSADIVDGSITEEKLSTDVYDYIYGRKDDCITLSNTGYYLRTDGGKNEMASSAISDWYEMENGETIYYYVDGYAGVVCNLYSETAGAVDVATTSYTYGWHSYTSTRDKERVKMCSFRTSEFKCYSIKTWRVADNKAEWLKDFTRPDYVKYLFNNVVCIGDSLTYGVNTNTSADRKTSAYPYQLSKMTGWNVENKGIGGITCVTYWNAMSDSSNAEYNNVEHDYSSYDLGIIYLGTNGGGYTYTLDEDTSSGDYTTYADTNTGRLCSMIEYIRSTNPDLRIFLVLGAFNNADILYDIAAKYDYVYVIKLNNEYYNLITGANSSMHPTGDVIHCGRIGYLTQAKSILLGICQTVLDNLTDFEYL